MILILQSATLNANFHIVATGRSAQLLKIVIVLPSRSATPSASSRSVEMETSTLLLNNVIHPQLRSVMIIAVYCLNHSVETMKSTKQAKNAILLKLASVPQRAKLRRPAVTISLILLMKSVNLQTRWDARKTA